ncbi:MAG TPA: triphosphoribosyl-dephospho-CoA synthase MdcB, partial [Paraburkholderia sp.]
MAAPALTTAAAVRIPGKSSCGLPVSPGWPAARPSRVEADATDTWLARLAVTALIEEALLTPKPALVDQRGSGAHR